MISCVNTRISFCHASVSASATTELYNRLRKASKAAFIEEAKAFSSSSLNRKDKTGQIPVMNTLYQVFHPLNSLLLILI